MTATYLKDLNTAQLKAATVKGNALIVAGAGTGKTKTLVSRVAYLIDSEKVDPSNILCITFTNKAAQEMQNRLKAMLGSHTCKGLWMGTFHGIAYRLLKRYHFLTHFPEGFQIIDDDDKQSIIKKIVYDLNYDTNLVKMAKSFISLAKEHALAPHDICDSKFLKVSLDADTLVKLIAVYEAYQKKLLENGVADFGDLQLWLVKLLEHEAEVKKVLNDQFQHILVDEFQDTSPVQFKLIALLKDDTSTVFGVGDDDQSIYGFRGSDIQGIIDFSKYYAIPESNIIRLEENYRSCQNLLDLSNKVILQNPIRLGKTLYSSKSAEGEFDCKVYLDDKAEAMAVATQLRNIMDFGGSISDCAVLYRFNAQSRALEHAFRHKGIPYKLMSGTYFFDRLEIKDFLAYLKFITNIKDSISLKRIINTPSRGVGFKTLEAMEAMAESTGTSMYDCMLKVRLNSKQREALSSFKDTIEDLRRSYTSMTLQSFLEKLIQEIDFKKAYESEENCQDRLHNIEEILKSVTPFLDSELHPDKNLEDFVSFCLLDSAPTQIEDEQSQDKVKLMTIHGAKGLEFDRVFLIGTEEGILPANKKQEEDLAEDCRLLYVALTRAKHALHISWCRTRFKYDKGMITTKRSSLLHMLPP